ncbi:MULTISPECIES: hypothetical protein [Pseudomonas]|uniref:Uncharacterized protein n=2 Tax=Pseudomonas TaxID=286 RepID=A0A6G1W194_9PSED|nr:MULTISPECIES: hypothetical protein [Pseudomonas]MQT24804.1 hypothetical protein [Pseudomonas helleri]MQU15637.1 hypothetical protein [Pseudomonas helleri]PAA14323.1 hypothetical protein CJU81_06025 [Pseudomonas fragi]
MTTLKEHINSYKTNAKDFTEKHTFQIIANMTIFFVMIQNVGLTASGLVSVAISMVIANGLFYFSDRYDTESLVKISFISFCALLCLSQFFQHAYSFSFIDWLVTLTEFSKQAPLALLGILAYIALPIGLGIGITKKLSKTTKEE